MIYDFDRLQDRSATECIKWNYYGGEVLPLWVADMDFVSPEPVIRALQERVAHGVFGYPQCVLNDMQETSAMRQTIVDWLAERHNWHVQPEELVFLPGVVVGFNLACHMFAGPRAEVLVQTPSYPPILSAAGNVGISRRDVELELCPDGSYGIDQEAFEAAITGQTRLFILCNPHNPVGRVYRQEELESLAEACLRGGVVICSDEIHCDLVFRGQRHIPIASLDAQIAQNTITLMAPSKTFNIAGLQCSFAVIQNQALREKYVKAGQGLVHWVNLMGWVAMQAAYREGQDWLAQLLVYLEGNRDYLYETVRRELPGVGMAAPEGTYLGWLDCRQAGITGNVFEFFLDKARVALNDGSTFGRGGEGFVRLNFACPRAVLEEGLERMKQALNSG